VPEIASVDAIVPIGEIESADAIVCTDAIARDIACSDVAGLTRALEQEDVMTTRAWLSTAAGAGLVLSVIGAVDAAPRKKDADRGYGSVQSCSNYGHGCMTAPTRRGNAGAEFRMPGGTWISCRQDCKTALREEALDFWETLRERAGDNFD